MAQVSGNHINPHIQQFPPATLEQRLCKQGDRLPDISNSSKPHIIFSFFSCLITRLWKLMGCHSLLPSLLPSLTLSLVHRIHLGAAHSPEGWRRTPWRAGRRAGTPSQWQPPSARALRSSRHKLWGCHGRPRLLRVPVGVILYGDPQYSWAASGSRIFCGLSKSTACL